MIPFANIPPNLRVPLFYAEIDNSQANTGSINQRSLVVAQMVAGGTATAGVPYLSQGLGADKAALGQGSMAALMVEAYRASDDFGELWVLPLADNGAGVAATGSITFTGPATAAGTLALYIGGVLVSQGVTSTMTAAALATALAATINANLDLPVSAVAVAGAVNLTADNKGPGGNEIDLRINYGGAKAGEATPAGITVTIVAMASGATPPSLTTPLLNLGDQTFDFIASAYTDSTSLDSLKAFLNDTSGRWSWQRSVYGGVFAAARGTLGTLTTLGAARNDQHVSIMGFNDSPTPAWIVAADYAGVAAVSLRANPARPLQTLAFQTMKAPPVQSRFIITDMQSLLFTGISTFQVGDDGTVRISNAITTYQKNAFSQADDSYLEVETLYILMAVLRALKTRITTKFARMSLADDGTKFAAGSAIVTPSIVRADQIAAYRALEFTGLVRDGDAFKAALIVERNVANRNRLDVLWPGTLMNQLRIFALLAQFRL